MSLLLAISWQEGKENYLQVDSLSPQALFQKESQGSGMNYGRVF